jgi:hypothetical protein
METAQEMPNLSKGRDGHNTAVSVNPTVEIDLGDWAAEHGMGDRTGAALRDDVRQAAKLVFEDWLRETIGFKGASVRVNK